MQLKDRLTIKIETIAFGGDGIGRSDGFVIFVPFAAADDEVEIEITACKKKFARGKILKIIKPSPLRVEPLCKHYEICGGCCYQHLSYPEQLAIKKQQVTDAFVRIGKVEAPPLAGIVASCPDYHYRGKAQIHQVMTADGPKLGFLDVSGGNVVDIDRCEIMDETINEQIGALRDESLIRKKRDARFAVWSQNQGELTGQTGQIKRVVKDREFIVAADGFFQSNLLLTEKLVDEVCSLALSGPLDTVLDVYCGCGLFPVFLAPLARKIFGVELNRQAVQFARINAAAASISNAEFICGDAGEVLLKKEFLPPDTAVDLLILDPPRIGCDKVVFQAIAALLPRRIIYVSCNPQTQARDVKYFTGLGYKLLRLSPLDMFPQTQHIEVIALLEY